MKIMTFEITVGFKAFPQHRIQHGDFEIFAAFQLPPNLTQVAAKIRPALDAHPGNFRLNTETAENSVKVFKHR